MKLKIVSLKTSVLHSMATKITVLKTIVLLWYPSPENNSLDKPNSESMATTIPVLETTAPKVLKKTSMQTTDRPVCLSPEDQQISLTVTTGETMRHGLKS